jgi:2-desacetyl-2-hydroxyethyl bacteriochlorophyllide A dehydrogenase
MMRAIVLARPGQLELGNSPFPPPPGRNEARVRIHRVGICGTDLHAFAGRQPFFSYPRILGHELAAEVLDIGPTDLPHNLSIGDRCCIRPYLNCGVCGACRRGHDNCCVNLQVLGIHRDGGMREVINIPVGKLHPSSLPDEQLALVEMLSIGAHAVRRAQIVPGEYVLVIGVGPIGLGLSQFAHQTGARVIVMDVSDSRLAFACQQPGVEHAIDAKQDVPEQLRAIILDDLPTVVFDATGNAQSMMKSFEYVAHGGRLVFVGLFQGDVTFHDPEFHRRELTLLASRNATAQDFEQVIRSLEQGAINVTSWITHRASPEQLVADFPSWLEPLSGMFKAMLSFT